MRGYERKDKQDYPNPNYGFSFLLERVSEFDDFKDPREDETYNFNIANL